jgi:hypothetical protein
MTTVSTQNVREPVSVDVLPISSLQHRNNDKNTAGKSSILAVTTAGNCLTGFAKKGTNGKLD